MLVFVLLVVTIAAWLVNFYEGRETIREADGTPYLIRYFLWKPAGEHGRIYLHHILRSDHDRALHCHPWNFTSYILWGGYTEITTAAQASERRDWEKWDTCPLPRNGWNVNMKFKIGDKLVRPAHWRHRLILPENRTTWTLVFTSKKVRDWGFYPGGNFCPHEKYDTKTGLC